MKAYLAGPIFTYGDLLRNTEWAAKIRAAFPFIDLYSPVENTDINGVEGKKKFAGSQLIANGDNARLDYTDVLIACIDGDVIPAGTAAEIGKFHEKIARGDRQIIANAILLIVKPKTKVEPQNQVSSNIHIIISM